jgi:hypothetical protein
VTTAELEKTAGWESAVSRLKLVAAHWHVLLIYKWFGILRQLNFVAQVFERNPPNQSFRNLNFIVG